MVDTLEYAELLPLTEIGKGGEGRIFASGTKRGVVFKEYMQSSRNPANRSALEELISLRASWSREEHAWLGERTVWPDKVVLNRGAFAGFTMPLISDQYFRRFGIRSSPRRVPCEWNYLSMRSKYRSNPNLVSEVPDVRVDQALQLVLDLAKTMSFLHRHGVVVGDVTGRNLLRTDTPSLRALIIDCDSFRIEGRKGVSPPKQSPDWDDPDLVGTETTQSSDIYKLALAAFRAVWGATTDRPQRGLNPVPDGVPKELCSLIVESTAPASRPSAADWVQRLGTSVAWAARHGNRPAVMVAQEPVTATPPPPRPVRPASPGTTPRPIIPMKGPLSQ